MLSRSELEAIKAALVTLAGENSAAVAKPLASLNWAINAEAEIEEIRAAGGFRCAASYRRTIAKQGRRAAH